MRLTPEQKAKKKRIAEKLAIRQVCKTPPKEKKGPTGEFELFKKIAEERSNTLGFVYAKHITKNGKEILKPIRLENLTHWNFDHTTPKSRGKDYKLDPENIQIVSVAWHFWKTNGQILQIEYPN